MVNKKETFFATPTHLALPSGDAVAGPDGTIAVRLVVKGQGTVGFAIRRMEPFTVSAGLDSFGRPAFEWRVDFDGVLLRERQAGQWVEQLRIASADAALDPSPDCPYWFSFDDHNRALLYGKGEMRLGTMLAAHALPTPAQGQDPHAWLSEIETVSLGAQPEGTIDIWRDPVCVETPLKVIPHDAITMDDIAGGGVTVPANLTPTCQILYDNVAGERFVLDTPDFPQFARAIKESIDDPNGWCAKTLKAKAGEFGPGGSEKETYLRITMGVNQGDSPGIPYVMEIWPAQHYSPIHDHGGSNAVIKVLHGKIWVDMFGFLSPLQKQPFATATFEKGDVTWISPRLNQVHKLHNDDLVEPCITIQCYMYAEDNRTHWPYFDYIGDNGIAEFVPNSDADFLLFKRIMQEEWERRHGGLAAAAA